MQEEMAMERFGNGGYVKCSEDSCGYFVNDLKIKVPMYCFKAELPYFTKNPTATPTPTPTEEYTLRPIGTITSTPTIWITATPTPAVFNTPDTDGDGIFDFLDNCPGVPNPDQVDSETEIKCVSPASVGEPPVCIPIVVGDGVGDVCDNCPTVYNPDQKNSDGDQYGDACDNCPFVSSNAQFDSDGDGFGNVCDSCPSVYSLDQTDSDNDGQGNVCDCDDGIQGGSEQDIDCGGSCLSCDICNVQTLPDTFDYQNWKGKNWLSPVKDQAGCGSCYAHAPLGAMEAKYNLEQNNLFNIDLSEQQFVSPCYVNVGSCTGGSMENVLWYLERDGVVPDSCFPYTSTNCVHGEADPLPDNPGHIKTVCNFAGHCSQPQACTVCQNPAQTWTIAGSQSASGTMNQVKRNLLCDGPLVVCSGSWWHCVVLTGWDDTQNSWIVKNSWGTGWRQNGFGFIDYNSDIGQEFLDWAASVHGVGVNV